jgi:undecaprenyl-diphosphatase
MDIYQAIILGIVEGITEYLPISSTGHLVLAGWMMGLKSNAVDSYVIVIQGGAILAVIGLYRKRFGNMLLGFLGKHKVGLKLAINLIIAVLPAVVLGLLFKDTIKEQLFFPTPIIAAIGLGGVLMLFASRWQRSAFHEGDENQSFIDIEQLTWKKALIIGLLQCIAMWPGTSRSMMTIVGGMAVGMKPKHAAEFSFLLGLPTLGGATLLELYDSREVLLEMNMLAMIVGIVVSFLAAAIAIKWLVAYLSKHGLALFGWYRIALAIVFAIGLYSGYFTLGNNAPNTSEDGVDTSSIPEPITFVYDHCPALPVATHATPSTMTGPIAVCQWPTLIS